MSCARQLQSIAKSSRDAVPISSRITQVMGNVTLDNTFDVLLLPELSRTCVCIMEKAEQVRDVYMWKFRSSPQDEARKCMNEHKDGDGFHQKSLKIGWQTLVSMGKYSLVILWYDLELIWGVQKDPRT